ncbi:MAG: hypothetical protein ABFR47_05315 [Verrucomicrobiota bacterium]
MAQDNRSFESTLHDIVYSIDTGTGLKVIRVSLYILFLLVIVMLYTATQFRGLDNEEAMDYAQLGRNISLNGGMLTTKCIRPSSMWKVASRNVQENSQVAGHPDLYHPPAYPMLLATGFKFFEMIGIDPFKLPEGGRATSLPAEQWVILPINHLFCILTGWIVFSLGKRLFSREIGFLGMTIYYLSSLVWQDSISGLNISMAGFFVAASFRSMVISMLNRRDGTSSVFSWAFPFVMSVVFASIAVLTRYIAIAAIPGIALFAWLMGGRFRGGTRYAVVFSGLCLILIMPWLYRNYSLSGNPLGLAAHTAMAETSKYPGNAFDRDLHPEFTMRHVNQGLKEKWVKNYSEKHGAVLPGLGGGVLMGLFITTFFYNFVRPQVNYLRWAVGLSLLLMVFIAGFFSESSINTIHVFWPFVILYGLAFFYILIDRLDLGARLYNTGLKCLIVALSLLPLVLVIMPPHAGVPYPPYYAPVITQVSGLLNEREVMCSDMPWATAWYGDRTSILLPKNVDDFYEINDLNQYISGMYITTITKNKPFVKELVDGPEQSWFPILIGGRPPPDFPLKEAQMLLRQDQIFFSDRKRWSEGKAATDGQQ